MAEITTEEVKDYLSQIQGKEVSLTAIRKELNILSGTKSFDKIRLIMFRLVDQKIVKPASKQGGIYKVITQVQPVSVFGVVREESQPILFLFPRDRDNELELPIADKVVVREGDLILISGVSNYGKTTFSMNLLGENIEQHPVLMGNEFTNTNNDPTPRFMERLKAMDWVGWVNSTGDKFTLLPVSDDFAEHVVRDRINIIDWINLESGEHYLIGNVLRDIKKAVGKGVAVVVLQKGESAEAGRGGQFTKDFADLEILLDRHGTMESRMTIGKCKESTQPLSGRSWAFQIRNHGVSICGVHEVRKCWECHGKGFGKGGECPNCRGVGWVDTKHQEEFA